MKIGWALCLSVANAGCAFDGIIDRVQLQKSVIGGLTYLRDHSENLPRAIVNQFNSNIMRYACGTSIGSCPVSLEPGNLRDNCKRLLEYMDPAKGSGCECDLQGIQFLCIVSDVFIGQSDTVINDDDCKDFFEAIGMSLESLIKMGRVVRSSPMFHEINFEKVDKISAEKIVNTLLSIDHPARATLLKVLEKYFAHLRVIERASYGFRGRVNRNKGEEDLARKVQGIARAACLASQEEDVNVRFVNALKDVCPELVALFGEKVTEGNHISQATKLPMGAPGFKMLSDDRLVMLNDPQKFVQCALEYAASQPADDRTVTPVLSESELCNLQVCIRQLPRNLFARLQSELLNVDIGAEFTSLNADTSLSKIRDIVTETGYGHCEPKGTLSKVINLAGLRTLCGPSGTTTDIIVTLASMSQKSSDIFSGLIAFYTTVGIGRKTDGSALLHDIGLVNLAGLNPGIKRMIISIAFYMQIGEYHSIGEVLTGTLAAAIALSGMTCDRKTFKHAAKRLLKAFAANPLELFPDADKISDKLHTAELLDAQFRPQPPAARPPIVPAPRWRPLWDSDSRPLPPLGDSKGRAPRPRRF
jgi:hypothetical protein